MYYYCHTITKNLSIKEKFSHTKLNSDGSFFCSIKFTNKIDCILFGTEIERDKLNIGEIDFVIYLNRKKMYFPFSEFSTL